MFLRSANQMRFGTRALRRAQAAGTPEILASIRTVLPKIKEKVALKAKEKEQQGIACFSFSLPPSSFF
jgi:hypothetical protein